MPASQFCGLSSQRGERLVQAALLAIRGILVNATALCGAIQRGDDLFVGSFGRIFIFRSDRGAGFFDQIFRFGQGPAINEGAPLSLAGSFCC